MLDFDILLDSDSVLADFELHCLNVLGKLPQEFEHRGQFWAALKHHDANVQKFFRHIPKCHRADDLVAFCLEHARSTKVCTAAGTTPFDVREQKREWYAELYPQLEVIIVEKSSDKAAYATPATILIDDREKSTLPFQKAGGLAILHTSVEDTIEQLKAFI